MRDVNHARGREERGGGRGGTSDSTRVKLKDQEGSEEKSENY